MAVKTKLDFLVCAFVESRPAASKTVSAIAVVTDLCFSIASCIECGFKHFTGLVAFALGRFNGNNKFNATEVFTTYLAGGDIFDCGFSLHDAGV